VLIVAACFDSFAFRRGRYSRGPDVSLSITVIGMSYWFGVVPRTGSLVADPRLIAPSLLYSFDPGFTF